MLRLLVGIFMVLHGLVHLLYSAHSQRFVELRPEMIWPDDSWAFSRLLGDEGTRWLATVTYVLAAVGFVVGGAGFLLGLDWWHPMVIGSAAFSLGIIVLFWDGTLQRLSDQGLIAVLINTAILVAMLILQPSSGGS
jgi:hypothetical protein